MKKSAFRGFAYDRFSEDDGQGRWMKIGTKWASATIFGCLALMALLAQVSARAQVATASINGTVVDSSGAVIPGVTITAVQTATNYTLSVISKETGMFILPSLPVGPYKIVAEKSGFGRYEQSGIVLTVGQVAVLQIALVVGAQTQSVTVTAEAPAVASTEATIQNVVEQEVVSDLPLNGRNPATLMFTAPGVTDAGENIARNNNESTVKSPDSNLASSSAPTTNGVRPGGTYFSLDGSTNIDPYGVLGGPFPNPDATQEFSIVTGSYGARYVSAPGGAVNVVTKSGTNEVHGAAYEFVRNGYFNARNYFLQTPDVLKRSQFGAAVGGPILKDRLFYFGSYQGTIIRNVLPNRTAMLTADERNGIFTLASGPGAGATVTLPIDPVAANILKVLPVANDGHYADYNTPNNSADQQYVGRFDYNIGSDRVFVRYFGDYNTVPDSEVANHNILTAQFPGHNANWDLATVGNTWSSKSGTWLSETRASLMKMKFSDFSSPTSSNFSGDKLGIQNFTPGTHPVLPVFSFGTIAGSAFYGIASVSNSPWAEFPRDSWDFQQDVTHPAGKHVLSFGGDLRLMHFYEHNESGQEGVFIFSGLAAYYLAGLNLVDAPFADMLLGVSTVYVQDDGINTASDAKMFGLYAEDQYRVNDRLTVTGGVRWDPYLPIVMEHGHVTCWNPGDQSQVFVNAPKGILYPGDKGCGSGGTTSKMAMVEPRIGVAYRLDKRGNTALRAGWGMYSMEPPMSSFIGFSAPPWIRGYELTFTPLDNPWSAAGGVNPFAGGFLSPSYNPPSNVSFAAALALGLSAAEIDPSFKPATVQQWTLSLQHALSAADSIELAYVGTEGVHLSQTGDLDQPVMAAGANQTNENQRRPFISEGLVHVLDLESNTNSSYNGLNATYRHRNRGGLDIVSTFNWSKCIDDGSMPPWTSADTIIQSAPKHFRGRCDFDQNVSSRTTVVWAGPNLKGRNQAMRLGLGSWMVTGLAVLDAGQPFSVTDSSDYSYSGLGLDLADRVPGVPLYSNGILNRNAFTDNAPGTYGNSGRNSFRGPSNFEADMGLMKLIPIKERIKFNFRAEVFNLFNHPNLPLPQTDYGSEGTGVFGTYTFARDPRILQFSLKLQF
jgi:hypothetical protein